MGNPKAKRVIFLCMAGGPSHLETYDYKPTLREMDGKPMPKSITEGQPIAQLKGKKNTQMPRPPTRIRALRKVRPVHLQPVSPSDRSQTTFASSVPCHRTDQSRPCPHLHEHGHPNIGRQHGLLDSLRTRRTPRTSRFRRSHLRRGGQNQPIASCQWHSGFLPSKYQGVHFKQRRPRALPEQPQRRNRKRPTLPHRLGQQAQPRPQRIPADPEISTKVSQYEMAFRMQTSVPDDGRSTNPSTPLTSSQARRRILRQQLHTRQKTSRARRAFHTFTTAAGITTAGSRTPSPESLSASTKALRHSFRTSNKEACSTTPS